MSEVLVWDFFEDDLRARNSAALVEFRLTYRGPLKPSSRTDPRPEHKHLIRRKLHPQLRELWKIQEPLRGWYSTNELGSGLNVVDNIADNFARCGHRFVPIVTERLALVCELDVLFLRRDAPGNVIQGGDLDNRLKTLFDALKVPKDCSGIPDSPGTDENPFFVLLEDDSLISKVTITTDRLLSPLGEGEHAKDVELVISAKIKVLEIRFGVGGSDENLRLL